MPKTNYTTLKANDTLPGGKTNLRKYFVQSAAV